MGSRRGVAALFALAVVGCDDDALGPPVGDPRDGGPTASDAGPSDPYATRRLGPVAAPATGSAPIAIEVPPGLASFTVVLGGAGDDDARRLVVLSLDAPDGTRLLDWDDDAADLNPASIPYPGVTTVMVPSTDAAAAAPVPGTWALRVGVVRANFETRSFDPEEGAIDDVWVVFEPADERGGEIDLSFFFSPGSGLTAGGAEDDPYVTEMLGSFAGHFEGAGAAAVGEVRFLDLPDEGADRIDSGAAARALVARFSRPGRRGHAINVFVIDELSFAAGFTGAIPGPPGRFDTAASGVVVERLGDGGRMGTLLAHEVGHFLGLRHTTELDTDPDTGGLRVAGADPITDTPSCPSGTAVPDCPDYRNLMFPVFPFDDLSLTDGQVAVLRASPWLVE